jgi:hypothetical protein
VHYIPEAASSLLSAGVLEDRGANVLVDSLGKTISITRYQKEVLLGRGYRKMWCVSQTQRDRAHAIQEGGDHDVTTTESIPKVSQRLLHARLGHACRHMEVKLNALMDDLGDHLFCPPFCSSCIEANMIRNMSRERMSIVTEKLGRVHV